MLDLHHLFLVPRVYSHDDSDEEKGACCQRTRAGIQTICFELEESERTVAVCSL